MPINVSDALDSDTAEIVTIERTANGAYVDGLYVPGATTSFKTIASVQQPSPDDLEKLPEGERNKDIRKFISKKTLRTGRDRDNELADVAYYKGVRYKIIALADWEAYGFTIGFGARE